MKLLMISVAIAISCLTVRLAQATPAGTLILANGDVVVRGDSGASRPAVIGMAIESGDTVATQDGRAQVKFLDGGLISLQPVTEFKITDYRFQDSTKSGDSAVFNLVKGGLRAITGLIGRREKADYQMQTPTAVIGIRGTEFQALMCASSCKEPDGLYVHTGEGAIVVRNAMGEVEVGKGQTAYVASPNVAPQRTTATPAMTAKAATTTTKPPAPAPVITGVTEPGFQPGTIQSTNSLGNLVVLSSAGLAGAWSTPGGSFTPSGGLTFSGGTLYSPGVQSGAGIGTNTCCANGGSAITGAYINGSEINGFSIAATNTKQGSGFASFVVDTVLNAGSDGGLYWGRWSNTTLRGYAGLNGILSNLTSALPSTSSFHYLLGTSVPTIPTAGTATYTFIGGTPSTDQSGTVGQGILAGGTLSADFLNNTVGANMTVRHGVDYVLTANAMPLGTNTMGNNVNVSRASFSSGINGANTNVLGANSATISGFFGGTSTPAGPSHAGISYEINAASPIVGVGAFKK